jgi:hypothetical protein
MHPHLRILLFFFLFYSGVSKAQMVTTIAGTGEMGFLDGPVDTAKFNFPNCLILDSIGNLYVSDKLNHKVRKIDLYTQSVSTFVGSTKGYSDGNSVTAQFNEPIGLAFSKNGDLFISDYKNSTIRVFHTFIKSTEHFAGYPLKFGLVDGKEGDVRFKRPSGIFLDKKVVYISPMKRIVPFVKPHQVVS